MERRDVVRSKKAIKGAYLEICKEKPLGAIMVREIIDRANVSRGTFYAHFLDVFDLQEKVEDEFLLEAMSVHDPDISLADIPESVASVVEMFTCQKEMIRALSHNGANYTFVKKCKQALCTELERKFRLTANSAQRHIIQLCVSSIIVDLAMEAALHMRSVDVKEMVRTAGEFIRAGLQDKI